MMRNFYPAFLLPLVLFALFAAPPVRAQNAAPGALTEEAIRKFYKDGDQIHNKPYADYAAFMQNSMADDFEGNMTMKITLAGLPPSENSHKQSKSAILAGIEAGYKSMKNATITEDIENIKIATDGKSASLDAHETIKGMTVPSPDGKDFTADSHGDCHDEVSLSPSGLVQVEKTECTSEVTINAGQSP